MSTNGVEKRVEKRKADEITPDTVIVPLSEIKDVALKARE